MEFTDKDIAALIVTSDGLMDYSRSVGATPETAGISALTMFVRLSIANGADPLSLAYVLIPKLVQGVLLDPPAFEADLSIDRN